MPAPGPYHSEYLTLREKLAATLTELNEEKERNAVLQYRTQKLYNQIDFWQAKYERSARILETISAEIRTAICGLTAIQKRINGDLNDE